MQGGMTWWIQNKQRTLLNKVKALQSKLKTSKKAQDQQKTVSSLRSTNEKEKQKNK